MEQDSAGSPRAGVPGLARHTIGLLLTGAFLLAGCDDPAPLRVGFIGGLTGSSADIGETSRNAVQLALEEANRAGGIDGRQLELLVRDDANNPQAAAAAVTDLKAAGVVAIIGPNLSSIAGGMVPVLNELELVTISPTVSALSFADNDDYFFRINWTTRDNARAYAQHYSELGYRHVAAAIDGNNRIFSESWLEEFAREFEKTGGEVVGSAVFDATENEGYARTAKELLAKNAEVVLLIANSIDTANLAQQIRKLDQKILLVAAEWAASERLVVLGGRAIDGLELVQSYDRGDNSQNYLNFSNAYRSQFQQEPDYASVAAYDAATVVIKALSSQGKKTLKQALLDLGPVQGLQQEIAFNPYGDARRRAFFVVIRDGHFEAK